MDDELYEVEKIKDHRVSEKKGQRVVEFKIRWKGYKPEDDTWEPRDTLLDGAEGVLQAYIARQASKGNDVPEDGPIKKSKSRVSEPAPLSGDSSSNKRKKKESMGAEPTAEEERPRKKEKKQAEPIDLSPEPEAEPEPVKKAKEPKKEKEAKKDKEPSSAPPSKSAPAKKRQENGAEESVSRRQSAVKKPAEEVQVEIPAPKGSDLHRGEQSWEALIMIETLETIENKPDVFRWFIRWGPSDEEGEWVSNDVARRRFPQRCIDFYEGHLKFKPAATEETEEVAP